MTPATVVRLALAGSRVDTLRVVLTALSAALATLVFLAAATVLAIPTPPGDIHDNNSEQYSNALLAEPGLRGGVAFSLLMLSIPVLALAAQCVRLGAPARDRRLAAIRLTGATPRQAVTVAAAETGLACLLGSLAGLAAYLVGRQLLHRPDVNGQFPLPTDVLPAPAALAVVVLGVPLLAVVVAAALLRKVAITPFGVVRRTRTRPPGPWPGLLVVGGLATGAVLLPGARWLNERGTTVPPEVIGVAFWVAFLITCLGTVLGAGWLSHAAGRLLHRFGRGPAALLASRRLISDPWTGSRTFAALLACTIFGAGAIGVRQVFATDFAVQDEYNRRTAAGSGVSYSADRTFYFRALDLVDVAVLVGLAIAAGGLLVALAESLVARRRAYASLVATGVPRRTLAAALVWQTAAPVLPAVLIAVVAGASLVHSVRPTSRAGDPFGGMSIERAMPVPYADLAVFGMWTVAATLVITAVGLLFLRTSTTVDELRTG